MLFFYVLVLSNTTALSSCFFVVISNELGVQVLWRLEFTVNIFPCPFLPRLSELPRSDNADRTSIFVCWLWPFFLQAGQTHVCHHAIRSRSNFLFVTQDGFWPSQWILFSFQFQNPIFICVLALFFLIVIWLGPGISYVRTRGIHHRYTQPPTCGHKSDRLSNSLIPVNG